MAVDAIEIPSPSSHSPSSHSSQQRHFYLAVDRLQFKMETLMDLLGVAGRRPCLPMVVCCSSRDELDAVSSAVANLPFISLASLSVCKRGYEFLQCMSNKESGLPVLQISNWLLLVNLEYSDLAEADRALVLEHFRQATMRWNPEVGAQSADGSEPVKDEQKSHMIVATDVCLPLLASGELPISAHVLINYELPAKKETYMRRMATCLAADGIVINMVVGGEVVTLKSIEESSNLVIAEMPINISEIL